jgi:hypothetical protein
MSTKDMPPKTVAMVAAVCLTTGWLLASMLAPPVAKLQSLPERRAARAATPAAEPAAAFTEQLHWRLQQAPVAPVPRRNPFTFGSKPRPSGPPAPQAAAANAPGGSLGSPIGVAPAPSGPIYSLVGIGSSTTDQGMLHTAVLSDGNTVHLVKAAEAVGGYTVVAITEDSVTLADAQGSQTVLRLR